MTLFSIVRKNLLRRPLRSLLTIVGIAIGIGAVVALTTVAWGYDRAWDEVYRARGTSLVVARIVSRDPLPAAFRLDQVAKLASIEGVDAAVGVLSDLMSIEDASAILVFGWPLRTFMWDHLTLAEGRFPRDDAAREVVLGVIAAEVLGKSVGDRVQIETEEFTVTGVFSSSATAENGAVLLPIGRLQALTARDGMANFINIRLDPSMTPDGVRAARAAIEAALPGFKAFDAGEIVRANLAIQAGKGMSLATSLIALVVGAVGVMNTVLMSVFERVQEIGVLLAIGWRRRRIILMILLESLCLSLLGGTAGIAFGLVGVRLLDLVPALRGRMVVTTNLVALLAALAVSIGLGVLGGVYPAWRGSRMTPADALRHE
jgi:putative ABC transport system permease protein